MKKVNYIVLVILVVLITQAYNSYGTGNSAGSYKLIKLISREMGINRNSVRLKKIELDCTHSPLIKSVYQVKKDGQPTGYAVDAQGKGRYDMFYYVIYYTEDLQIDWIRITGYFSNHGGQISSKKWLKQFYGFGGGDLNYGKDIQAISGATKSATSITKGIAEITNQLKNCEL